VPADQVVQRGKARSLGSWSAAKKVQIKPGPGADITKVIFVEFKWTPTEGR
jgi:hypothetical protein